MKADVAITQCVKTALLRVLSYLSSFPGPTRGDSLYICERYAIVSNMRFLCTVQAYDLSIPSHHGTKYRPLDTPVIFMDCRNNPFRR